MLVRVYFVASGCHPCLCSAVQVKLIGRIRFGCNLGKYNNQPSDEIILIQQCWNEEKKKQKSLSQLLW